MLKPVPSAGHAGALADVEHDAVNHEPGVLAGAVLLHLGPSVSPTVSSAVARVKISRFARLD